MDAPDAAPVLQVQGLHFGHPGMPPLFCGWSFNLLAGVTLLEGDTGSGKTTLLRLLARVEQGAGALALRGQRADDDAAAYRQQVCLLEARDPAFDALDAAGLMALLRQRHPALDTHAWEHHLQGFGLQAHRAKPLFALSTGSRQKAALAAVLSTQCALTLLDEPTTGLDVPSVDYLAEVLAAVADRAVLMVCSRGLEDLPLAGTVRLPPAG